MTDDKGWLEAIWEIREETICPDIFGGIGNEIYPLSGRLFTDTFKQDSRDPSWLNHGVFESPPNNKHQS